MPTFIVWSEYGEIADVAIHLANVEKYETYLHIADKNYKKIADGLVPKVENWWDCLGEGYIWIVDGTGTAPFQDWLREQGESVFGSSEEAADLENDRQLGQDLFRRAGFDQPESHNFTSIDEAISFVEENRDTRWILKQNGDAPKHLNHMGKFDDSVDMLYHLKEMKKEWNEAEFGKFDCDLMEVVTGTEIAASAFWNGHDWMRNKEGKVVGFINFEEKKEADGGMGETCGEMGTVFIGVTEDDPIFEDIMLRPEIGEALAESGFRGAFDINGCITDEGDYVAFEATSRPGVPSSSYEFIEGMEDSGSFFEKVATGSDESIEIKMGVGMVMCVVAKPFPLELHVEETGNSLGERLWPLQNGKPVSQFDKEQAKHIHFYNFALEDTEDGQVYKVATDSGYMLTVTASGNSLPRLRAKLIDYIKENLYLPGMKYRTDIGARAEEFIKENYAH